MGKNLSLKIILTVLLIGIIIFHVIYLNPIFISQSKAEELAITRFRAFFNKLPSNTITTSYPNGTKVMTESEPLDVDLFYVDDSYDYNKYANGNTWVFKIRYKPDSSLSFIVGVYSRNRIVILPNEVMVTVRGDGDTNHTIAMLPTFI